MKLLADARVRLLLRAVLAGIIVGAQQLQLSNEPFSQAALAAAGTAAFLAIAEVFTPLNALVGWFKHPPA